MPTPVEKLLMQSAFVIGYDKKGDPIDVVEGEGYTILEKGDGPLPTDLIGKVKEHLKLKEGSGTDSFPIEVKTTSILHIGSKSCHIVIIGGRGVVVCG